MPTEVHPPFDKLPPDVQKMHLWLERRFFETLDVNKGPAMMESWRSAFSILHQASLKQDSLAGLPLVILTRENVNEDEREQQKDLLHLSSRAKQTIAVHSGHFIQIERPDLVIASINEILSTQPAQDKTGLAAKEQGDSPEKFVGASEENVRTEKPLSWSLFDLAKPNSKVRSALGTCKATILALA